MRSKEYAHDYRYFPEPDLPPLTLDKVWVEEIRARLPELPDTRRNRFMAEYGLPVYDANLLTVSKALADYFEDCHLANKELPVKNISNWLSGPTSAIMNTNSIEITEFSTRVSPEQFTRLLLLESEAVINAATAKSVLEEMYKTSDVADDIIERQGLSQISDQETLEAAVVAVINSNQKAVADFKVGKAEALKFLVGQLMRATKGRANPVMVSELLKRKLEGQ